MASEKFVRSQPSPLSSASMNTRMLYPMTVGIGERDHDDSAHARSRCGGMWWRLHGGGIVHSAHRSAGLLNPSSTTDTATVCCKLAKPTLPSPSTVEYISVMPRLIGLPWASRKLE
jgi:hypothetical protein